MFLPLFLKLLPALAALAAFLAARDAGSQGVPIPKITVGLGQTDNPGEVVGAVKIFLLLTVLSLAPAILITMTSFARIVIVFSFLRQAMGTTTMPPNQILIGLSLFLSFYVMAPVWKDVHEQAVKPYLEKEIGHEQAFDRALKPLRRFMLRQVRESDLATMLDLAKLARPRNADDIPTHILVPAFILSEVKTAFQMGFMVFVPFLVLDMVVASVLMAMGMMMLPPVLISLPFKIMIFVIVDGWNLIVGSLVRSFG